MLELNRFAIQENKTVFPSVQTYDIRNGDTGELVGTATETLSPLIKTLRWVLSKHWLPTRIEVREKPDDSLVFTVGRSGYLFRSRVEVRDAQDVLVGYFKSHLLTISGGFAVYDQNDTLFAQVQGRLFGFDYCFITADNSVELGRVSKRIGGPAGVAREVFFSADNYFLEINPDLSEQPLAKMLLVAAALAIDLIYKSQTRGITD